LDTTILSLGLCWLCWLCWKSHFGNNSV